jgi:hypothetical protein
MGSNPDQVKPKIIKLVFVVRGPGWLNELGNWIT